MPCSQDKSLGSLPTILATMAVLVLGRTGSVTGALSDARMTKVTRCPGRAVSSSHFYMSVVSRSVLDCVAMCGRHSSCLSLMFEAGSAKERKSGQCHLTSTTPAKDCSNTVSLTHCADCRVYEKARDLVCENGGSPAADGETCDCRNGFYGNTCNIAPVDCEDCITKGINPAVPQREAYFITPVGSPRTVPVMCEVLSSGRIRTRVAIRNDAVANFNLSWQSYRDGFGDPDTNTYWLGLGALHYLTSNRHYQIRFRVSDAYGKSSFGFFDNFVLGDEAAGYSLSINPVVPDKTLGNCLPSLIGSKFSTHDVDNDGSATVHCAQRHGGGWWFKGDNCSTCNPFGPILPPFDGQRKGVPGEAFWTEGLGSVVPFTLISYLIEQA